MGLFSTKIEFWHSVKRLGIELTDKCNANCIFCPRELLPKIYGDMPLERVKATIDDVSKFSEDHFSGLTQVNYGIFGETTLYKDLCKAVEYSVSMGLETRISTNASGLTKELAKGLMESGLDIINISIDNIDKESFEATRVGLNWDMVSNNIKQARQIKKDYGYKTKFVIYPVISKENEHQSRDIVRYWSRYSDSCHASKEVPLVPGRVNPWTFLFFGKIQRLLCDALGLYSASHCYDWFTVKANGDVVMCCQDFLRAGIMGNVFEQSVRDIYFGERVSEYRYNIEYGEVPDFCKTCRFLPMLRRK